MVRDLVNQHGQRGYRAQAHVRHEGGGNQNAVAKAMHAVTREHSPTAGLGRGVSVAVDVIVVSRMIMIEIVMMVFMTVVP